MSPSSPLLRCWAVLAALLAMSFANDLCAQSNRQTRSPAAQRPVALEIAELKTRVASLEREVELLKTELRRLQRSDAAARTAVPPLAQPPVQPPTEQDRGIHAVVTLANGTEIQVENVQLSETPGGLWIGGTPKHSAAEFYYRYEENGITVTRTIPFSEIDTMEFTTVAMEHAGVPTLHIVQKISIQLRDGGRVEWIGADQSVTVSSRDGTQKKLKSLHWIDGVVRSGRKTQGQEYSISGFTGIAVTNGERGEWQARPEEVKRIRFATRK